MFIATCVIGGQLIFCAWHTIWLFGLGTNWLKDFIHLLQVHKITQDVHNKRLWRCHVYSCGLGVTTAKKVFGLSHTQKNSHYMNIKITRPKKKSHLVPVDVHKTRNQISCTNLIQIRLLKATTIVHGIICLKIPKLYKNVYIILRQ